MGGGGLLVVLNGGVSALEACFICVAAAVAVGT